MGIVTQRSRRTTNTFALHGGRTMLWRRRYERVAFYCSLDLKVQPDGPTIPSRAFDISLGGVGVTSELALERGQTVRVCFHLHNGSEGGINEDILGRVAYSKADEDGVRMGIEFLETIRESSQPALARKLDQL
jgi:c-di-GMP-binding flagellar brake protein YcgR